MNKWQSNLSPTFQSFFLLDIPSLIQMKGTLPLDPYVMDTQPFSQWVFLVCSDAMSLHPKSAMIAYFITDQNSKWVLSFIVLLINLTTSTGDFGACS